MRDGSRKRLIVQADLGALACFCRVVDGLALLSSRPPVVFGLLFLPRKPQGPWHDHDKTVAVRRSGTLVSWASATWPRVQLFDGVTEADRQWGRGVVDLANSRVRAQFDKRPELSALYAGPDAAGYNGRNSPARPRPVWVHDRNSRVQCEGHFYREVLQQSSSPA